MNLEYKGLKSTRFIMAGIGFLSVTSAYIWGNVTSAEWIGFVQWTMAIYAGSEVGAKGAVAFKSKP